MAFAKNVSICEISLNQRDFFHTNDALLIAIEGSAQGFEARNNALPGVLRYMFLRRIVRSDNKLDKDI